MAVQSGLVLVSIHGAPSTAVITTSLTRFTMDIGEVLLGRDQDAIRAARDRASHAWPAIVGFALGATLGAALYAAVGLSGLTLPAGLALLALIVARSSPGGEPSSP
jgi:uncharacterized membrane protein YoaK (UPF0700 family)